MTELTMTPQDQDLLFREARTANAFTGEPVTEEQVRAIHDLVKWAPTALNAQPLRVLLVPQGEPRERLLRRRPRRGHRLPRAPPPGLPPLRRGARRLRRRRRQARRDRALQRRA